MKACLVNYNYSPTWLFNYPEIDYLVYDRSDSDEYLKDFPKERIIKTENIGNVDYDKLSYLVESYDNLPDVFLWGKTNLEKFITQPEFDAVKDNKTFTPLLTTGHKTYHDPEGQVCFYKDGIYYERNNSWYLNAVKAKYFDSFDEWAERFGIRSPEYIPFAPGGNYILTKEVVHKHPKELYQDMRNLMDYTKLPGEAHLAERSYYLLWS